MGGPETAWALCLGAHADRSYHVNVTTGSGRAVRATATVLFTDLVGSTELRSRVGEQNAEELRRKHDRLLTETVEGHGGRVIKGLGDGVMATFASASDAAAGAVAIQRAINRLNRSGKAAVPLSVRVGLSAGDVTFEDEDVHGMPVIEASRLCAAAAADEILVADVVRVLAGLADDDLADRGRLELKGLQKPLPAWEVCWERVVVPSIPMPALLTDVGRIFVGRDAELERLGQLWKDAVAGERGVALLAGEPGVGKTRLAAELAMRVHEEGAVVLAGRCDEDLGVPYQPFVEILRHFVDHTPTAELKERLGRYGGELARLMPELTERVPGLPAPLQSDSETERYRLFDAVAAWLAAAASHEPVLLGLDDLQWAAKPTLLLLRHVVQSAEIERVLILGSYRDTELTHDHPLVELVADLRRQGGVDRLPMSGLDDLGVATLVEQAAGRPLDEGGFALARAIYQETEGNPFFVSEVLRHLIETGAMECQEGGWATRPPVEELGIPEGVRDVVARRLSRLAEDTNQVLRVAAVAGTEFELPVLEASGTVDEEGLLAALEEAAAARLVIEASATRYRFAHALVRDTLYEELTAARRVSLHRRVAQAIETCHAGALDDYLPALAHHWARASAPAANTARAVDYAARAGNRALAQLAHDEAVAYYRQALELLAAADGPVDEVGELELLLCLGEAEQRAGDPAHRETLLRTAELARRRGDATALARAALASTRGLLPTTLGQVDYEKVAALEAAISAVGDHDPAARARLLATLGVELAFAGDWRRCLALSDEALSLARSLGEPETLARVLLARNFPTSVPGLLDERLANAAELLTVVGAVADPALVAEAHLFRGRTALEAGDVAEADRCYAEADRLSAGLGQPALRWRLTYIQATRAIVAGRFADAERLLFASRDLGRLTGQPDAEWVFTRQLVYLRLAEDRMDEETMAQLQSLDQRVKVPWNDSLVARAACVLGRLDQARAALQRSASTPVPFDIQWLSTMLNWAAVAAELGDAEQAEVLEQRLSPYAALAVAFVASPSASVAHHLGLLSATLGRFDEAEDRLRAAAAVHERIGAPHWLARTRVEWARTLLTRRWPGDGDRARQLLGQAATAARELGLAKVERDAAALLQ